VFAILGVIGYFWWQSQPKSYRLIASSDTAAVTLIPCKDGYLTQEKSAWVLRAWETGKERWRVKRPAYHLPTGTNEVWSIGQQGDVFALITPTKDGAVLRCWKNGQPTFTQRFSAWRASLRVLNPDSRPGVRDLADSLRARVLNDGRVIAWAEQPPRCPAAVVRGGSLIARGTLPFRKGHSTFVAPDGQFAAVTNGVATVYAPLAITDGQLTAAETRIAGCNFTNGKTPPYYEEADLLAAGQGLTESGAIFDASGPKPSDGWEADTVTPGGVYLLQTKGPRSRVYAPSTGEQWSYYAGEDNRGGDATMDGRYALSYFTPDFAPQAARLLQWLSRIPGVGEALPDPYTGHAGLYERPGRLRALLRIDLERWWPGHDVGSYWWFPSPDGRAIAINLESYGGGARCLLFRW